MSANVRFSILVVFIFCCFIRTHAQSNCLNPNQRKGYCIYIRECPVLFGLMSKSELTDEDRRFIKESNCTGGLGEAPFVCCSDDAYFHDSKVVEAFLALIRVNNDLLPGIEDCGDQPSGSKIYSGKVTELDEFPWMALLNYGDGGAVEQDSILLPQVAVKKVIDEDFQSISCLLTAQLTVSNDVSPKFYCAGSLINSRYVLTAAHCVVEKHLHSIRLGEYDTTKDIDCIDSDCADPVVNVYIEEIIVHPNYNVGSIHRHNDIALIRLKDNIEYTSFISPVCMPSVLGLNRSDVGTNLIAAGWGRTLDYKSSPTKLKISLPINSNAECQNAYRRSRVHLLDFQLCAGGTYIEDTCDGDSGGPLMSFKGKWAIEGIVSFSRRCGLENVPGIYTRVVEYEDWIKSNLKP